MSLRRLKAGLVSVAAGIVLAGCVPAGPVPQAKAYGYAQSVLSGRLSDMGDYNTVSSDGQWTCHVQALPAIRIVAQPAHGEVLVTTGQRPFGAKPNSPFAHCGGRSFVSKIVQYRPAPGYRGPDHLAYEVAFVDGTVETYEKILTVQ
jgi:hypothetical protein